MSAVFFNIDIRVYARYRNTPGPFTSSIGTAALLGMKRKMHDFLSAVGACSSYTSASRLRDTIDNLCETTGRYPVPHSHSSVLFSADNYDEAHLHQLHHANGKSNMINGTTVQRTTSLALPSSSCQPERRRCPSQTELLRGDKIASASDFVNAVVTKHTDPHTKLCMGLYWTLSSIPGEAN